MSAVEPVPPPTPTRNLADASSSMDREHRQDRSFRAAQSQRAAHSAHRHRLRRRVHGSREHQLCRAADESRPALQRVELRLGRGAFLPELRGLRDTLEPVAVPVRRAPVDRANHAHLGPAGDGHDVREDAAWSFTSCDFCWAWPRRASSPEWSSISASGFRQTCAREPSAAFTWRCRSARSSWADLRACCSICRGAWDSPAGNGCFWRRVCRP